MYCFPRLVLLSTNLCHVVSMVKEKKLSPFPGWEGGLCLALATLADEVFHWVPRRNCLTTRLVPEEWLWTVLPGISRLAGGMWRHTWKPESTTCPSLQSLHEWCQEETELKSGARAKPGYANVQSWNQSIPRVRTRTRVNQESETELMDPRGILKKPESRNRAE